MTVVWDNYPVTMREIIDLLPAESPFSTDASTVQTLLHRMKEKELLAAKRKGRAYYYSPMVSREQCLQAEAERLGQKLVSDDGKRGFLKHFLRGQGLTAKDLEEIAKVIPEEEEPPPL